MTKRSGAAILAILIVLGGIVFYVGSGS